MSLIAFIDTEVSQSTAKIIDIGSVRSDDNLFHSNSITELKSFLKDVQFICGHNIIHHDLQFLQKTAVADELTRLTTIDTLYLSPLLFPSRPYHALLKDDKLQTDDLNNPLNDAKKARSLFDEEVSAFRKINESLQAIYCSLLYKDPHFTGFFQYIKKTPVTDSLEELIRNYFNDRICYKARINAMIANRPIELAYCLALINAQDRHSITPPWVLKSFPEVEQLMTLLRNRPCLEGCTYCNKALDIHSALKRHFDFDQFRTYAGNPLQEKAALAAVHGRSLLAVFPTGGGKSITFQLPALMAGENNRALTVVISPLQSLMKDQVDNLDRVGIQSAVTINGLLDPIDRAKSIERVEDGSASMLYISPESLRSRTIEKLLLGRKIERFVIDEAHCFSSWGQDFRVDYLYIGDFIKSLQAKKNMQDPIPVSCFTATAKKKVIEDICNYFKEKLNLEIEVFSAETSRTNLTYRVLEKEDEDEKYTALRHLIQDKDCPAIVYVSRTRNAEKLAERLNKDGFPTRPYHGKMNKREKSANQDDFISGKVNTMVATSAFGMGVDKKDVKLVVHYEISDSLENYVQEAGRAGRDEHISADCYVLYNEDDLNKHFVLLNQTKITIREINQVWRAIKNLTKFRSTISNSALEIARKAGWDVNLTEIETRVTTAISALEQAGYVERKQNMPRIFATSILSKNAQEAIGKIHASDKFTEKQREMAVRIIKKLISAKSRKHVNEEEPDSRVDYISDHLGIVKEDVIRVINLMREAHILADTKDMSAFIPVKDSKAKTLQLLVAYANLEKFLMKKIDRESRHVNIRSLNEEALENNCKDATPQKIKTVFNFWAIKKYATQNHPNRSNQTIQVQGLLHAEEWQQKCEKRHNIAQFIIEYFHEKATSQSAETGQQEVLVEFSVHNLLDTYVQSQLLFDAKITIDDIEDALFFLSRIEAIKIEGGFLVVYNALSVNRVERDNKVQYKVADYAKFSAFYENKIQQIHIVGEYAKRMVEDYKGALQFVDDYFKLNYPAFLSQYFPGSRQEDIKKNISPKKFRELFGELSARQLNIIKDKDSKYMVVAAGPGSGKTRILVHKLASLLLMEDVKHEQLLMVTFSRAAATEFKSRLMKLIGNAAHFIDIKTFHAYCFDILGRVGNKEKSELIVSQAVAQIEAGEVEQGRITKTVLVIDEAQDMNAQEFALIKALVDRNDDMRIIAVGDDDQNIYAFRGSDATYMKTLAQYPGAQKVELVENYRSKSNLVDFANQFLQTISGRLKSEPIQAIQSDSGEISITQYASADLSSPLIDDVLNSRLTGTTAVLTHTNDEAFLIAGLLRKKAVPARIVQSNDQFDLIQLCEIRFFIDQLKNTTDAKVISEETWDEAKRSFKHVFQNSSKYELVANLLTAFELVNPKYKYTSDFEVFVHDMQLESLYSGSSEVILVSTMHKAKGKEFDNVFLLLRNYQVESNEQKRLLYMAITRAKSILKVHTNGSSLSSIRTDNLHYKHDQNTYPEQQELYFSLGHEHVNLGYFEYVQKRMSGLRAGDILVQQGEGYGPPAGATVLKFSKKFSAACEAYQKKGFAISEVKIGFMLFWKGDDMEKEIVIILPEVIFKRCSEI